MKVTYFNFEGYFNSAIGMTSQVFRPLEEIPQNSPRLLYACALLSSALGMEVDDIEFLLSVIVDGLVTLETIGSRNCIRWIVKNAPTIEQP